MEMEYVCYVLISSTGRQTYVGCTNRVTHRLRQHNGELVGGAKYTQSNRPWHHAGIVSGFRTRTHALQFEWAWKHSHVRVKPGLPIHKRIHQLWHILQKDKCTSSAPLSNTTSLQIQWKHDDTKSLLESLKWPAWVTLASSPPSS